MRSFSSVPTPGQDGEPCVPERLGQGGGLVLGQLHKAAALHQLRVDLLGGVRFAGHASQFGLHAGQHPVGCRCGGGAACGARRCGVVWGEEFAWVVPELRWVRVGTLHRESIDPPHVRAVRVDGGAVRSGPGPGGFVLLGRGCPGQGQDHPEAGRSGGVAPGGVRHEAPLGPQFGKLVQGGAVVVVQHQGCDAGDAVLFLGGHTLGVESRTPRGVLALRLRAGIHPHRHDVLLEILQGERRALGTGVEEGRESRPCDGGESAQVVAPAGMI